ncbi:MAG: radical SAM protein [Thermodesulfobacteriota bacterium]
MKILLVYPCFLDNRMDATDISAVPMGLYYLGALLSEHGHSVQLLNMFAPGTPADNMDTFVNDFKPDIVGFSIVHANRWGGIDMAGRVKTIDPAIVTVFGGVGATFLWRHLLDHFPQIDYVVVGEGEYAFLGLAESLAGGGKQSLSGIKGLAYRKDGEIVHTGPPVLIEDLDRLPNPARYFSYQHVAISRGCPQNCTFCGSPAFWGRRVRFHSADYFVRQLRLLYEKGVRFFYVSDDTFTLKKDLAITVCRTIVAEKLPITWAAISRVDLVDAEILSWMRRAGCIQISYGVESGSEAIRGVLDKRISRTRIIEAFEQTMRHGILARAYFIYGSPGENDDTIEASLDLIEEIKPLSVVFYMLTLFPGTALYRDYLERTGRTDEIWMRRMEDIPYFETDASLSRSAVMEFGRRLRTFFYERLPDFARACSLTEDPCLSPGQADFYSRLAMTFTHGDYAANPHIQDKPGLAEELYRRALSYHPDHRAFLGLGMLYQQQNDSRASADILTRGLDCFPDSEPLTLCLGTSYLNLDRIDRARECFNRFPDSPQARRYIEECDRLA